MNKKIYVLYLGMHKSVNTANDHFSLILEVVHQI